MQSKIAVMTLDGRAYYHLVNELRSRKISFLNLLPSELIHTSIEVVITTEQERQMINHPIVLVFDTDSDPSRIVDKAIRIVKGKDIYDEVIVGVDPGQNFALAVIADGEILKMKDQLTKIKTIDFIFNELQKNPGNLQIIKIGNGVSDVAEELANQLMSSLPDNVVVELVNEEGTSSRRKKGNRKKVSDVEAAVRIARKKGVKI